MSMRIALALAAGLAMTACASSTTTTTETAPLAETMPTAADDVAEIAVGAIQPAPLDMSGSTAWFAMEKLWPESPYMALENTQTATKDTYSLSFSCNVDNAAITGRLASQLGADSDAATYTLTTADGKSLPLEGVYALNEKTGETDFIFGLDWLKIQLLGETDRTDILNTDGESEIALITDMADKTDTRLLASLTGFEDARTQFYYYCNPK